MFRTHYISDAKKIKTEKDKLKTRDQQIQKDLWSINRIADLSDSELGTGNGNGETVKIAGWVYDFRDLGKLKFI